MTWLPAFAAILGSLLFLMGIGVPIAFSFLLVTTGGIFLLQGGGVAFQQMILSIIGSVENFALVPIPLFIFMGAVLWHSDLGRQAVDAIDRLLGRLPGRLAILTMLSGSVFSALSGSTMANTAMLGKLLLPQLRERGYSRDLSMGPIMAAGGLAMMIPPSSLAVVLATLAKLSVAKILIAAIVPGLIMAALYILYIVARAVLSPASAPATEHVPVPFGEALRGLIRDLLPLGLIVLSVTGLIVIGIATPTEAAAMGAISSLVLCAFYGRLTLHLIREALFDSIRITIMTLAILAGALGFTQILAYSGATSGLLAVVMSADIGATTAIVAMMLVILVLGCFMDQVAIMLITLPIFIPLAKAFGFDTVVLGVLILINLETALMTPPLGLLLVVMKGAAPPETRFSEIYRAALPFVLINILVIALVIAFPGLVSGFVGLVFR